MRRGVWFLILLSGLVAAFTFGTFYSRSYARLMPGESETFSFYVFGDAQQVRIEASHPEFYVTVYPGTTVHIGKGCYGQKWVMSGGKYEPACRIDVKVTPKTTIRNGRYRIPVVATAVSGPAGQGISMSVAQSREFPIIVDVHGALPFIGSVNYSVIKPVARIAFSSAASSAPAAQAAIEPPAGSSAIRFIGRHEPQAEEQDIETLPATALAISADRGVPAYVAGLLVVLLAVVAWLVFR